MDVNREDTGELREHIEADAVCENCGAVNPEDTLLCKQCGNNLRDQRHRRMSMEGALALAEDKVKPRQILKGLFVVLGLLLILLATFRADDLFAWLVQPEATYMGLPEDYWDGPEARLYDQLQRKLDDSPISRADIAAAQQQPSPGEILDGRYYLKLSDNPIAPIIGHAYLQRSGDTYRFVAELSRDRAEIRGQATQSGEAQPRAELVAVKVLGKYISAYGFVDPEPAEDGAFICYGQTDGGERTYEFRAYYVPGKGAEEAEGALS